MPMHSAEQISIRRIPTVHSEDLDVLPLNMSTSGKRCASVVYKRSSEVYGSEQPDKLVVPKFGLSNTFSRGQAQGGMLRRHGLETSIARERVVEGSKDWLTKIL